MSAPTVAVVVPTRNRHASLRSAVASILAQDYAGRIDVVVVNDGGSTPPRDSDRLSSSRTLRLVESGGVGPAAARNVGWMHVDAPYVAFCDDDDHWLPTKLRMQIDALERSPDAALCVTGCVVDGRLGARTRAIGGSLIARSELLASRKAAAHMSSFVLRRSALNEGELPFDATLPYGYAEDWDLLLRVSARAAVIAVDRPLVRASAHHGSFFARNWNAMADGLQALLVRHPAIRADHEGNARICALIAFAEAARGQRRSAFLWLDEAVRLRPFAPRTLIARAAVHGRIPASALAAGLGLLGRTM